MVVEAAWSDTIGKAGKEKTVGIELRQKGGGGSIVSPHIRFKYEGRSRR